MVTNRKRSDVFAVRPRIRRPVDWRGTMAYDAFRVNLDYLETRTALVAFYEAMDWAQHASAAAAGFKNLSVDELRKRVPP